MKPKTVKIINVFLDILNAILTYSLLKSFFKKNNRR